MTRKRAAVRFLETVDDRNRWMIDRREKLGLTFETS